MRWIFTIVAMHCLTSALFSQTFCLRLSEVSNDGTNYVVRLEMQGSFAFDLGSSNLQWAYNPTGVSNPVLLNSPLAPPFYLVPTVTSPGAGEVSFNIELGFAGFGTTIAGDPGWTELGQVIFTILDPANIGDMDWTYNGGTTQTVVFLDDEITQIFATDGLCLEGINAPAPIELLSFSAQKKDREVLLEWQTTSEINNRGFEVQRSPDGKTWEKIGWVEGQGNSHLQHHYELLDPRPINGINYYRLNQLDEDGRQTFSDIREVAFSSTVQFSIAPNPADQVIQLSYENDIPIESLLLFDQWGRICKTIAAGAQELKVADLVPGTYYLKGIIEGEVFYEQVVIAR